MPSAGSTPSAGADGTLPPKTDAPPDGLTEACTVRVTGDTALEFRGMVSLKPHGKPNSKTSIGTDYWLSAAELQATKDRVDQAAGTKSGGTNTLVTALTLNCGAAAAGLSLTPGGNLSRAEFPQGPGTYDIVPRRNPRASKAFTLIMNLPDKELYEHEQGKLVITAFDEKHIAGTFSFSALGRFKKKKVQVEGKFDFPCEAYKCPRG